LDDGLVLPDSLVKIIMSKKVASSYLRKISSSVATMTVYFLNDKDLNSFVDDTIATYGPKKVAFIRGFDYVTVMTDDRNVFKRIQKEAHKNNLNTSGV
jgi:hypothetical protein